MFYVIEDPIAKLTSGFLAEINFATILIRITIACLFASMLGIERSNKRHTAGLRTFILVSLASTLAALVDAYFVQNYSMSFPLVSAASVIGISIISANSLLYSSKSQIKGLTTAVALYSSVFLGIGIGAGLYTISLIGFLFLITTLNVLPAFERYLKNRSNHFEIHLELKNKTDLQLFTATIRKLGLMIDDIESNPAYINSGLSVYTISLTINSKELKEYKTHAEIMEALRTLEYVNCIEEIN